MNDEQISIRMATPSDREGLRAMFARCSPRTIYRRFHAPLPVVPWGMVALMLDTDHHDTEALLAVADGKVVGHAMYARLKDDSEAEMAIVVEDEWQSRGVGKALLQGLEERARLRGVETFTAEVLGENRPMLGLASKYFGTDYTMERGVYRVRIPVHEAEPVTPVAAVVPRAA